MPNQNEFDLGSAFSMDRVTKTHIRYAYEQVLNYGARLSLFASGKRTRTRGPIDDRQEVLALDDLTSFALHARRLIELTPTKKRFPSVKITNILNGEKTEVGIIEIFGKIIHHKRIDILRDEMTLHIRNEPHRWAEILADNASGLVDYKTFPPKILVRSDREGIVVFNLGTMIEIFQDKILNPIIAICEEHNCYLDSPEEF